MVTRCAQPFSALNLYKLNLILSQTHATIQRGGVHNLIPNFFLFATKETNSVILARIDPSLNEFEL